jgi:hypothetical protein
MRHRAAPLADGSCVFGIRLLTGPWLLLSYYHIPPSFSLRSHWQSYCKDACKSGIRVYMSETTYLLVPMETNVSFDE